MKYIYNILSLQHIADKFERLLKEMCADEDGDLLIVWCEKFLLYQLWWAWCQLNLLYFETIRFETELVLCEGCQWISLLSEVFNSSSFFYGLNLSTQLEHQKCLLDFREFSYYYPWITYDMCSSWLQAHCFHRKL